METKRPYNITGTRCGRCGSEGPFLLDPGEGFVVDEGGDIRFLEGEWGLDIDCDCSACGFAARLGDFYEWVEVTGAPRPGGEMPGDGDRAASAAAPAKDTLPVEVAAAIEGILWSYWQEALEGFVADEPGPGEGHIFRDLVAVDRWFSGHVATAEELVETFCSEDDRATARARVRSFRG